jgi:hypothetical protein
LVVIEIIAHGRKNSLMYIVEPCYRKVVLRSRHRNKNVYEITNKKRSNKYKRCSLKLLKSVNKIEYNHYCNHGVIGKVSQIKGFANMYLREILRKQYGRLVSEYLMFNPSEDMIQIWEKAIKFVCIRIPITKHGHLETNANESKAFAREGMI